MVTIVLHYASEGDIPHVLEVERAMLKIVGGSFETYKIHVDRRCGSAHKTPKYLLEVVRPETESCDIRGVVLGRQPALGPALDATTQEPVITYLTDGKDNPGKVYSSLDVPSGVGCMTAPPVGPEAMALALLKIATLKESRIKDAIRHYQNTNNSRVINADSIFKNLTIEEAAKKHKERNPPKK